MSTKTLLTWTGPYQLAGEREMNLLLAPDALRRGVYLWTVRVACEEWAHYVGETGTSFFQRHAEHLASFAKGEYQVCDPELFARGEKALVWEGALGRKHRHRLPIFRSRLPAIAPKLQAFVSIHRIFLVPVEGPDRRRERLESALAGVLKCQTGPAASFLDPGIRYSPCLVGEPPLHFYFERPLPIAGLADLTDFALPLPSRGPAQS